MCIRDSYRSPVKVGLDNIDASVNALAGIDSFAARTSSLTATPDVATLEAFRAAMNDDLNTPVAMGVLFDAVRRANIAVDSGDTQSAASVAAAVREMCTAVGLELEVAKEVDADAQAKAVALDAARAAKDFATADKLRTELQMLGYLVETTKAGTTLRRS